MRLVLLLLGLVPLSLSTIVSTSFGDIEGFEHLTEKGIPTHVFLGVRYGQSPDIHNRFKKADLVEPWKPILHHAKSFKAACIPYHEKALSEDNFSEDCLFLNIITPTITGSDLPVWVFIHGGGYEVGSARDYGYKKLAETLAAEGIVVVTIQYRLGPFGFFSLGDSISPGNMGLWDQTLALHFLHEVLPSFGGDVNRITIAGHSAGAASASALQFSPHSNSMFQQAYLMSGSSLTEFALSDSVVDESKKLAKVLGCLHEDNSDKTISCLQEKTPLEILEAVDKIGSTRRHNNILKFHPRLDGDFFPYSIERLAKSATKQRSVTGVTNHESALFVLYEELSWLSGLSIPAADRDTFSRENLIDFIETVVVTDHEHHDAAPAFRRHLIDFYVEKDEKKGDSSFYLQRFIELASDLQFLIPLYHEVQIKLANNWPTWMYVIEHEHVVEHRKDHPVQGAYHADELQYFADFSIELVSDVDEIDSENEAFGANFVKSMVAFVKNGDPSFSGFSWPRVSKKDPFIHAVIKANNSIRKEAFRADAARLWLENIPKSVSGESLRKSRMPGAEAHIVHTEL